MVRLNGLAAGLAFAILWAGGVLLAGLLSVATGGSWCGELVKVLGSVYKGYSSDFLGIIAGLCWGFADGFLCGIILAFLYNLFATAFGKEESKAEESSPQSA